ncbi:MAG: phage tail spike protein [Bacillota bacterium]
MPILYEANATDFNNLGLGPLVDTTVATVTEERNGQFILEMQYPVEGIRSSLITKNRILKVDAGHKLKDQRFVIKRINRIMGNDGLSYSIYAEHISYITADYALKPNLTISGSGNVAMTQWLNGIIDSNRIHVDSDITTENTTNLTIDKVQNARQALGGVQGSILDVWGGEYRFDNLNISLLRHRGTVSNTMLSYGRNITDFDQEENITNTYTSIYPFASYSVQNGDTSEQKILTIPDLVVDSEYVNNFPNRKIQVVDFSDKLSTDEKPTVERLAELAKSYIKSNNVGVPTVSTKISFVDLSKTENYKEFAPLEELDLCDEVPFAFEKFGIKTTAKISRIVWNVLLDSYDSLELGELKTNLSDVINNTNNAALDAKDAANDAKNSADNAALSANGKNRNWYGADDPAFGHLSELREGDSWYKPNGEDTELYYWENGQWVFILSTKDANDAADAADKASKEAEEAKTQANKAVDGANDAAAKAGFANDTAEEAKSDAAAAGQQAKDALTSAGTALTDAKKALTDSSSAMADSAQARKDSATAIKDAADSLTSAKDALNKVGSLTTSVTSQFTTVNNELKSKVNQTDYDKLKGTVTSQQTEINQNASGIKLKADKSYADTINNSVVKNTSSVGLLNDQIALTVSKNELNNTLSSYATQTWAQSQIKSTADSINLSVTKVQNNLDNMELGSVNLIIRKDELVDKMIGQNGTIDQYAGSSVTKNIISVEPGKYLTMTRYNSAADNNFRFAFYDASGAVVKRDYNADLSHTEEVPPKSTTFRISYGTNLIVKLERGQKGTEYSAAPEDLASEVQFSQLQLTVNGIQGTVQNKADQSQVTHLANQISLKADTTALNELKGTVDKQGSEITLNTNSIKLKADQSSVNTLKGTVDKQGSAIDVNTKAIALKASQSTVDTLSGRVSTAEGKITVQADQIAQTVSKTELTTKLNGYATQTWTQGKLDLTADGLTSQISSVQTNLDNLNGGGRNYVLGSDNGLTGTYTSSTSVIFKKSDDLDTTIAGNFVTISFDIEIKNAVVGTLNNRAGAAFSFTRVGGASFYAEAWYTPETFGTTYKGRIYSTVYVPNDAASVIPSIGLYSQIQADSITLKRPKVAIGNIKDDWSPAPEDQATVAQFTSIEQTLKGVQITANNAVTQSQYTQLAGQITSVVKDVAPIKNLFPDPTFDKGGWLPTAEGLGWTVKYDNTNLFISNSGGSEQRVYWPNIGHVGGSYSVKMLYNAVPGGTIRVGFAPVNDADMGTQYSFSVVDSDPHWVEFTVNCTANTGFCIWLQNGKPFRVHELYIFNSATGVATSQFTQLQNDINLRVQKGDVVNQINISPESILIAGQKVHITGQTSIDNAVIKDAMIADIKADKITAGTLNAANVNVINLNANSITTGTLKGANLSLNLNTGEVLFQKGAIRSTNGNLNIHIDDGSMSLTNSLGNGAYFKDGNIYMTDSDIWTPGNPKIQYGTLKMVPNFLSDAGGGVALKGPNGVVVGTDEYPDTGILGDLLSSISGGGITLTKEHIRMASEGDIGIAGGKMYNTGFVGEHPAIQVGIAGSYTAPMPWFPSGETGDALFLSGKVVGVVASNGTGNLMTNTISDLSASCDARSGYVLSAATYKRTYGSGDTVTITPNGVFGRISSASKYKLAIGEISTLTDEAHQFLSVKPKQWFDKSESEALADSMTTGNTDYVDDAKALPHNGFIAEDLYTAGLDGYVIRSNDGSIESIQYDRLPVLHHELIRELFNRLDAAEMEIYKLKQEVLNNAN